MGRREEGRENGLVGRKVLPRFLCPRAAPCWACVLRELAASVPSCTGGTVTILDSVAFCQDPSLLPGSCCVLANSPLSAQWQTICWGLEQVVVVYYHLRPPAMCFKPL